MEDSEVPTRDEWLAMCKQKALSRVAVGELEEGWSGFVRDMRAHPETADDLWLAVGSWLVTLKALKTIPLMRRFIEGFK